MVTGAALAAVPEIRDGVTELNDAARELIADMIAQGQQEGAFRKDVDPKDAACAVLGILRGVVMQYLADADAVDLSAQLPLVKDMVLRGLK